MPSIALGRVELLRALKAFTEETVAELRLPTRVQRADEEQQYRAPDVYSMRLPDSKSAQKKAPYILHQVVTGKDEQQPRQQPTSECTVRTIVCVYDNDEQQGALSLLEVMERLRVELLRQCVIGDGNQYWLDLQAGVEALVYPDDTAPYYIGEMSTVWHMPAVKREVRYTNEV